MGEHGKDFGKGVFTLDANASRAGEFAGYRVPSQFLQYARHTDAGVCVQLPPEGVPSNVYDNPLYFSENHGAYQEGYDLPTRLRKYKDAIGNVLSLGVPLTEGYVDIGGGPGLFSYGVAAKAIEEGLIAESDVPKFIHNCDVSKLDPRFFNPKANQSFTIGSLGNLPYAANTFGAATCFHVLEHLQADSIGSTLLDIKNVMKDGGRTYFIIPTLDGVVQRDDKKYGQILFDKTHLTFGDRNWWMNKMNNSGLVVDQAASARFDRLNYGWVFVSTVDKGV